MMADDPGAKDAYYAESRGWAADREAASARSRRLAWIAAAIAGGLALLEAIALIILLPLKTVVPYTVLVDRQTGYVQALDARTTRPIEANAALTQSLLVQYVEAREGFDIGQVQASYRKVGLWSAETARNDYLSMMRTGNPASPLARYPRSTIVDVEVKSVSPIAQQVALVRFDATRRDGGGGAAQRQPWAAIVRYRFSDAGMTTVDRFHNPLGFQVVRYRKDPEALPQTAEVATPYRPAVATAPASPAFVPSGPVVPAHPFTSAGPMTRQPTALVLDARTVPLGSPLRPSAAPRP